MTANATVVSTAKMATNVVVASDMRLVAHQHCVYDVRRGECAVRYRH